MNLEAERNDGKSHGKDGLCNGVRFLSDFIFSLINLLVFLVLLLLFLLLFLLQLFGGILGLLIGLLLGSFFLFSSLFTIGLDLRGNKLCLLPWPQARSNSGTTKDSLQE